VTLDDVRQEAANIAFAQVEYRELHGTYASDISELDFNDNSRIASNVFVNRAGDQFCVDASYGSYLARTWENQFAADGETVTTYSSGSCNGQYAHPDWTDPAKVEEADINSDFQMILADLSFVKSGAMGRFLAWNVRCYDRYENDLWEIEQDIYGLGVVEGSLSRSDLDRARDLVSEYERTVNQQWNC
jgi:hypothetical protein